MRVPKVRATAHVGLLVAMSAMTLALRTLSASDAAEGYAFELPTASGGTVSLTLENASRVNVVFFIGTECPLVRLYSPRVQRIVDEFNRASIGDDKTIKQSVRVVGVSSSQQDSLDDLSRFSEELGVTFEIGKDVGNVVADQYAARRMSEVVVLDQLLQVRYRGRVDDEFQPGVARSEARSHDLKDAIAQILEGKHVAVASTQPVGCLIGRVRAGPVTTELTYARDIAPLLSKHCVECHQTDEIGPFALTDYNEIVGWGEMMVETIDQNRMPPWHADPEHGKFANARLMRESEKQTIRDWVDGGMPFGDATDLAEFTEMAAAVEPRSHGTEWHLDAPPDIVATMSTTPFRVPETGTIEYQYYVVDPGFESGVWVRAAEVRPGNRSVVHHCIVFVRPPDHAGMSGIGLLAGYVPGQRVIPFADGHARHVPAGSRLVFQMHYTPTGTEQEDLTSVGLWLADERDVTHEVYTTTAISHEFEIPPHANNHMVTASRGGLPEGGLLLSASPHMHLRGKSFKLLANRSSATETLLSVPHYDFNWQHVYAFAKPISLSDIDRLTIEARFDNSSDNLANPDPTAHVFWGDQTDEEMAIGFFEVAVPRNAMPQNTEPRNTDRGDEGDGKPRATTVDRQTLDQQATEFAREYIDRFDANADGVLVRDEMPVSIRRFGWRDLDLDRDGQLTSDDLETAFRRRQSR